MIFELFHSIYVIEKVWSTLCQETNLHFLWNFNITILGFLLLKFCYAANKEICPVSFQQKCDFFFYTCNVMCVLCTSANGCWVHFPENLYILCRIFVCYEILSWSMIHMFLFYADTVELWSKRAAQFVG